MLGAEAVDIIVPIYGAAEALGRCLDSVLRQTDLRRHRLLLVVDGPQADAVERVLQPMQGRSGIEIRRNAGRLGFPGTANAGLRGSGADAVLLNSDTQVTADWVEKLQAAAGSDPAIATVTPFSNNATICSLPQPLEANALPRGFDLDQFALLVQQRSVREYPRLPTGVGVCLYMRRAALERLGLLDEHRFGLGYGEETEWCARASRAGYCHILDDATFIFHEGQRSFGRSRARRVRAAHRTMQRLHPEYLPAVARFLRDDPLQAARQRVRDALVPTGTNVRDGLVSAEARVRDGLVAEGAKGLSVVHLVHGWPPYNHAGTEMYASWLAARQVGKHAVSVYARMGDPERNDGEALELLDGGVRVRLTVNNFTQRNPLVRNGLLNRPLDRDFQRFLDQTSPDLVHVHHLAGHSLSLIGVLNRRRLPFVFHLHDWWTACARANLLDDQRRLCSGPGLGKCSHCLPMTRLAPASLLNRMLYGLRDRWIRQALRKAACVVVGSTALEASLRRLGVWPKGVQVAVLPYGIDLGRSQAVRPTEVRLPLRFGILGSVLPHKGLHVAVEAFRGIDPAAASLEIWGDATAAPGYTEELRRLALPGQLRIHPRFPEGEKARVLEGLDVLLVPSVGMESYGLIADEAMACGVPVIAARRGVLGARLEGLDCGLLYDPEDPAQLRAGIERVLRQPALLEDWRGRLPGVNSMGRHAQQMDELYARILKGRT